MIFVSMVGLVLTLCLAFVYLRLACRFFKVKAALPALKLKDGLGRLAGTRVRLAALGTLFFLAWFASQLSVKLWAPDMLLVFNYEEAARGQNPNVTRFNESGILSESILEQVIQRGALELTAQELAGLLASLGAYVPDGQADAASLVHIDVSGGKYVEIFLHGGGGDGGDRAVQGFPVDGQGDGNSPRSPAGGYGDISTEGYLVPGAALVGDATQGDKPASLTVGHVTTITPNRRFGEKRILVGGDRLHGGSSKFRHDIIPF